MGVSSFDVFVYHFSVFIDGQSYIVVELWDNEFLAYNLAIFTSKLLKTG